MVLSALFTQNLHAQDQKVSRLPDDPDASLLAHLRTVASILPYFPVTTACFDVNMHRRSVFGIDSVYYGLTWHECARICTGQREPSDALAHRDRFCFGFTYQRRGFDNKPRCWLNYDRCADNHLATGTQESYPTAQFWGSGVGDYIQARAPSVGNCLDDKPDTDCYKPASLCGVAGCDGSAGCDGAGCDGSALCSWRHVERVGSEWNALTPVEDSGATTQTVGLQKEKEWRRITWFSQRRFGQNYLDNVPEFGAVGLAAELPDLPRLAKLLVGPFCSTPPTPRSTSLSSLDEQAVSTMSM